MKHSFDIVDISEADDTQILKKITAQNFYCSLVDVKNAGTCFRFLTALFAIQPGEVILTGSEDMKNRPIKELVKSLRQLGAEIHYLDKEGFPPLRIEGKKLKGDRVIINASISSQYASALLLIAPFLENGLTVVQEGEIKSQSYTKMTISLLRNIGVEVKEEGNEIQISPFSGTYHLPITVEKDWSSVSYWYEYISLLSINSKLQLNGVKINSIQGDSEINNLFKKLGVITLEGSTGIEIVKIKQVTDFYLEHDFSSIPDMVQTFAVTLAGLGLNGKFTGISHLIYKETNRIEALKTELKKLNYDLNLIDKDSFELVKGGGLPEKVFINTYKDHRMAMAFAPLVAVIEEVEIENYEVVVKSYPGFWDEFY
jgi:3-phosphoshikimate 1-carboxyvinyltransferase